jgi:predicted dehydrogenase
MNPVRLGVIGCGGMARAHMKYFASIPALKFAAAADAFADNVKAVCEANPGVKGFDDGLKLIHSGDVDAILICTPHYFHPELAIAGLKAGLHVLTEKPVAVTAKALR